jgi:DNA-binding LacI/PurR family transcriptional regulator
MNSGTSFMPMVKGTTTLKQIADRCSVDTSTVSRVLNNSHDRRFSVSQAVRNRIFNVTKELDYRPNVAARNLSVRKTHLIAVLGISKIEYGHIGPREESISALIKAFDVKGYDICVQLLRLRREAFEMPPLRVDGIVAVGPTSLDDLQTLEISDLPYVSLNGVVGARGSQVVANDCQGMWIAIEHLKSLGHTRIVYLNNPCDSSFHSHNLPRDAIFAQMMLDYGLQSPIVNLAKLTGMEFEDFSYEQFLRRSVIENKSTAVIADSHIIALSILRAAHDLSLTVPGDFSLICFNNMPELKFAIPSVTAVELPSAAMGCAAAELLFCAINKENCKKPRRIMLDETLILRESTAAPASAT